MSSTDNDYLHRFIFEQFGVRGEFVRMAASWRSVREKHDYPAMIEKQLGSALAAVLLLSGTIKFKGSLIMQLQGDGLLRSMVAQATQERTVRGMASFNDSLRASEASTSFNELLGHARMVLTAESPSGERYQGIVPAEGDNFAQLVEGYFAQSEQLPSRIWLAANGDVAAGLFLQRLPGDETDEDEWQRVCLLADTIKDEELFGLDAKEILHRLFNADDLRIFDPEPVSFRCSCSRERIGKALVSMGEGEVAQMLEEMDTIEVDCEFCNAHYSFDMIDAAALFKDAASDAPDSMQ